METDKSLVPNEERWNAPYERAELKELKPDIKAVTVRWQRWTAVLVLVSAVAAPVLVALLG